MKKHVMSMTYPPKIEPVQTGECTQTIRIGRKFEVNDSILIHGWSGKAYRSKWNNQMRINVVDAIPILVDQHLGIGTQLPEIKLTKWHCWNSDVVNRLAELDFIDPPTGEALKWVLFGLNGAPCGPTPYQIVRWEIDEVATAELRAQAKAIVFEEGK